MNAVDQRLARDVLKTLSVSAVFVVTGPPLGLLIYGALSPELIGDHVAAALVLSYIAGFVPAVATSVIYARLPHQAQALSAGLIGGAVSGVFTLFVTLAWGATIQILSWSLVLRPALHMTLAGALAAVVCSQVVARVRWCWR